MSASSRTSLGTEEVEALGRQYAAENGQEYDEADEEALGTAVVLEGILTGEIEEYEVNDVDWYMAESDDFDYEEFVRHKAQFGETDEYSFMADAIERYQSMARDFQDLAEAVAARNRALYEEANNERESAVDAINDISDSTQQLRTDTSEIESVDLPDEGDVPESPEIPGQPEDDSEGRYQGSGSWDVRAEASVDADIDISVGAAEDSTVEVDLDGDQTTGEVTADTGDDWDGDWAYDHDFFDPGDYDVPELH